MSTTPTISSTLLPEHSSAEPSRAKAKTERPRLDALDGLRALASVFILTAHFVGAYGLSLNIFGFDAAPCVKTFLGGSTSVSMFFVLSGFLLSTRYQMAAGLEAHRPFRLASFYIQRIARILPTFILILLVSWVCHGFFNSRPETQPPQTEWVQGLWAENYTPLDILKQSVFKSGIRSSYNLVPQDWTLRITTKLILLMPFLIILATRSSRWLITFTVIAVTLFNVETHLIHFMLGILISKHRAEIAALVNQKSRGFLIGGVLFVICFYLFQHAIPGNLKTLKWIVAGIAAAGILMGAIHLEPMKRLLSSSVLRFTGKISFGIYLWHLLILIAIIPLLIKQMNQWNITNPDIIRPVALLALFVVTCALSVVSYYLIEQPSITLGKKLSAFYEEVSSAWR